MRKMLVSMASLALACFAIVATLAQGAPRPTPHPTEAFAALPEISGAVLSPSGEKIAARVAVDGEFLLVIVPLDGSKPRAMSLGKADISSYRWVNDDWLVVPVSAERASPWGGKWTVSRIFAVKADGSNTHMLLDDLRDLGQVAGELLWVANDGSPHILMTAQRNRDSSNRGFYPEVYKVNVATGSSEIVSRSFEGVFDWSADSRGVLRMGIGYSDEGRKRRVVYRSNANDGLREIESPTAIDEAMVEPWLFLTGDDAIAYTSDVDGFGALYAYDPSSLELGERLHATEGYDLKGVVLDPRGERIAGIVHEEEAERVEWLLPEMQALDRAIRTKTGGIVPRLRSFSDDLQKATFTIGDADSPGATFLYDAKRDAIVRLGLHNPDIGLKRLHPTQAFRYESRDGLQIEAMLTLPTGLTANMPLIMMPHGGPYARDNLQWDWIAQFLADRGYAVLQPNFRGSSGYGREFALAGEGQWGLKMQDDLIDGITHLAKMNIVDRERVCIVGASYGGYAALRAAQRDAEHYRCAASYAGVSDLNELLNQDRTVLYFGSRSDWLRRQAPDLKSVSPLFAADETSIPVLLVHGTDDRRVNVRQSRDMARALRKEGKPFRFIEQEGADHFFSTRRDRLEWLEALETFLAKHNPAH